MNRRMILNTIMLGMFIFLFAFKLFPRPWHQIIGVAILLPVLFHVINNRRWFSALKRGRWNRKRRLWTTANLALLVGVLFTVFTGFLCSDYMTTSYGSTLPYNAHLISKLHKLFAKILLLLIAGHVFFHWKAFSSWIRHGLKR
ncbi:MAG: cytochrome b/b6 domain-containing protein [Allisonella histaminiformans]|uniref:cytochrome b/b6 domain-containing protein n=2 Tax=Allisonella histaminiformans TaxID=209880 RepID=UPI002A821DCF|nr:cytochrome b/b6 domain-containing protein [Allisonella histaminiformans]MDY3957750.1 cytochrome b/b6 domain-containing protein [Allisonella histaminiformans]